MSRQLLCVDGPLKRSCFDVPANFREGDLFRAAAVNNLGADALLTPVSDDDLMVYKLETYRLHRFPGGRLGLVHVPERLR